MELRPGYRDALDGLQRLDGRQLAEADGAEIAGAGLDGWRVVIRQGWPMAVNDLYPRVSIPLEMLGKGEPKILSWQMKEPPTERSGNSGSRVGRCRGRMGRKTSNS